MMQRAFFFLFALFLVLFSGCARDCGMCPRDDLIGIVITQSHKMNANWDLKLETSCVNYCDGVIKLNLVYSSQEILDVCDARDFLVELVSGFLDHLNEHPVIGEDLVYSTFTAKDLDLVVTFESFYGRFIDLQYVNQIRMSSGCVTFYAFDAFDSFGETFHKHAEYYEASEAIIKAQRAAGIPPYTERRDRRGELSGLKQALEKI